MMICTSAGARKAIVVAHPWWCAAPASGRFGRPVPRPAKPWRDKSDAAPVRRFRRSDSRSATSHSPGPIPTGTVGEGRWQRSPARRKTRTSARKQPPRPQLGSRSLATAARRSEARRSAGLTPPARHPPSPPTAPAPFPSVSPRNAGERQACRFPGAPPPGPGLPPHAGAPPCLPVGTRRSAGSFGLRRSSGGNPPFFSDCLGGEC